MKKIINYEKMFDVIVWSIFIITFGKAIVVDILLNISIQEYATYDLFDYLSGFVLLFSMFIATLINIFMKYLFLLVTYFGFKIAKKLWYREKVELVDLKNDNYYRDILPKYSAALLSYLDDFKVDIKDVVATLMILELKGKIKINENNIMVLDNVSDLDLEDNEKYILNMLRSNELRNINLFEYSMVVRNDAKKLGLVLEKDDVSRKLNKKKKISLISLIVLIVSFFVIWIAFDYTDNNVLGIILIILFLCFIASIFIVPGILITSSIYYAILKKLDSNVRSNDGKKINAKLEGLRKFLLDFSNINDKNSEELKLWEEYLVYSVIFGINTKAAEDVYNKI